MNPIMMQYLAVPMDPYDDVIQHWDIMTVIMYPYMYDMMVSSEDFPDMLVAWEIENVIKDGGPYSTKSPLTYRTLGPIF